MADIETTEAEIVEVKEPAKTDLPAVRQRAPLVAQQDGVIVGSTFEEQWRIATTICASGLCPKAFNTPEKVWVALQFAHELGLRGGMTALRQIYVVNGQPAIWGDLPLALIKRSGKLKEHVEYFYAGDGKRIAVTDSTTPVFGAYCSFERNDEPGLTEATFTYDDAKRAGLMGKDTYKAYGKDMLMYRARGRAGKVKFPDVLMGAAIAEYDYGVTGDVAGNLPDVVDPSVPSLSASMNEKLPPRAEVVTQ